MTIIWLVPITTDHNLLTENHCNAAMHCTDQWSVFNQVYASIKQSDQDQPKRAYMNFLYNFDRKKQKDIKKKLVTNGRKH